MKSMDKQKLMVRWIAELRSGKYHQGMRMLHSKIVVKGYHTPPMFCCLGVLCHMLEKDGLARSSNVSGTVSYAGIDSNDWHSGLVPASLKSLLPKDFNAGVVASMNDRGLSFDEIANRLELIYTTKQPTTTSRRL